MKLHQMNLKNIFNLLNELKMNHLKLSLLEQKMKLKNGERIKKMN